MKRYNLLSNKKGAVFVEFCLVLPIFVVIFVVGLTIINTMKNKHDASSYARAVGNIIHANGVDGVGDTLLTSLAGGSNGKKFRVIVDKISCSQANCANNVNVKNIYVNSNEGDYIDMPATSNLNLNNYVGLNEANMTGNRDFFKISVCYNNGFLISSSSDIRCETFYY